MVKIDFRNIDGSTISFLRAEINAAQRNCKKGTITASGVIDFLEKWRRILASAYPCSTVPSWAWTINMNPSACPGSGLAKRAKSTIFSLKFSGGSDVAFLYNFRRGIGSDMRFLIEPDPTLGSANDRFGMRSGVIAGNSRTESQAKLPCSQERQETAPHGRQSAEEPAQDHGNE